MVVLPAGSKNSAYQPYFWVECLEYSVTAHLDRHEKQTNVKLGDKLNTLRVMVLETSKLDKRGMTCTCNCSLLIPSTVHTTQSYTKACCALFPDKLEWPWCIQVLNAGIKLI